VEGYVRNRPDGTVEVVVQGTSDAVSAFLAAVESHFTGYIDRIETGPAPQVAAMKGFTIRY
jgi:acylphosphatase